MLNCRFWSSYSKFVKNIKFRTTFESTHYTEIVSCSKIICHQKNEQKLRDYNNRTHTHNRWYLSPKNRRKKNLCFVIINTKQKRWKPTCYKLLKFSCVLFLNYLNHTHIIRYPLWVSWFWIFCLKSVATANKVFVM